MIISLTPVNFRLGNSYSLTWTITSEDTGEPANLTGVTPTLVIVTDATETATVILSKAGTVTDAAAGKLSVAIAANDFTAKGDYLYEIRLVFGSGDIKSVYWGEWIVA